MALQRERATVAYRRSLIALSTRLGLVATAAWNRLPGADKDASEAWLASVIPLVLGAQSRSVVLTDAYLATFQRRRPIGLDPTGLVGVAVRGGISLEEVYNRPLTMVAASQKQGSSLSEALALHSFRVSREAASDVQLTARAARVAWGERTGSVTRWRRVSSGGCPLCASAANKVYGSSDLMPMHPGCRCVTEPTTEVGRMTGDAERIVNHGEMGPMLVAAKVSA